MTMRSNLPLACTLSLLLHVALFITWPGRPDYAAVHALPQPFLVRLSPAAPEVVQRTSTTATLAPPAAAAPPTSLIPDSAPTAQAAESRDTDPAPAEATAPPPLPYMPAAALTHPPELLTNISASDWPSTPGAPPGMVAILVDIGSDGRVMRVEPDTDPNHLEAAGIFGGFILGWRFRPGDLHGKAVPTRIRIEVEIADTPPGLNARPVALPQPAEPPRQ